MKQGGKLGRLTVQTSSLVSCARLGWPGCVPRDLRIVRTGRGVVVKAAIVRLVLFLLLFSAAFVAPHARADTTSQVVLVRVKGVINPVTAAYIVRGIDTAEQTSARAVVIQLDTPGGLMDSMRDIIQRMLASKVPVVVYVSPAGARAASAGTFITMAANVAAMAPNTNIGAAHPVSGNGQDISDTMGEKITNDAVAQIRGLADERGRNADWAESAVRESKSLGERDAVRQNVVDLMAEDVPSLLRQIDGREVKTPAGPVILQTADATVVPVDMDFMERFLLMLSDPNIAYLLLSLAMTALFLEFSNPGAILPGVVGAIALLLALFSLGMLPINYAGLALIFLGFILFFAEVKVVSHGMLALGGVISMGLGSLMLINSSAPYMSISRPLIAGVVLAVALFFTLVVGAAVRALRKKPASGQEGLIGQIGVARSLLNPEGYVFIQGARWDAVALEGEIQTGEEVIVTGVEGLRLYVMRYLEGRPGLRPGPTVTVREITDGEGIHPPLLTTGDEIDRQNDHQED
ncbi:MAG: nodulation protein NfeD [Chloroflexota bacterium]|nr:MAG: nodulation protein NfeD [Chloroflexota bacterium]